MELNPLIKVLLVEGDPADAALFQDLVKAENSGLTVQWEDRLSSAMEIMAAEHFDIVVMDLDLPDSKGIDTFAKVHEDFPYTPIVVLSGMDDQDVAIRAVQTGAQDYLIKGRAKGDSIVRLIKYSIERQRLLSECDRNLKEIKTLRGLIPICAWCHKVHSDQGYWERVDRYVEDHSEASFSHSICPECLEKTEPEIFARIRQESPEFLERAAEARPVASHEIRILLVEDDDRDAELVHTLTSDIGDMRIQIKHADRLTAAIELLQQERFDLVLSDLGLPDSRGIETFVRLNTICPDIPIVLMTGVDDKEMAAAVVRSGAQDYVVKGEIDGALLYKTILYAIERHKMRRDLQDNLRKMKKLQRERENILSMFAHDIKNSVIPSSWLLSRMLAGKAHLSDGDIAPARDALFEAEGMLADFIEFSRFETTEYKPVIRPFDMEAAIRKQVAIAKPKADEKAIKIICEFSEELFTEVSADGPMVQRVIANLLENAVKYTGTGGSVNVSTRQSGSGVLIQVRDTGIGISEEHLGHIFDAFYRASGTEKGSGLGLAIARMIVRAHGGEIWVQSNEGKGSTFSFSLPQ